MCRCHEIRPLGPSSPQLHQQGILQTMFERIANHREIEIQSHDIRLVEAPAHSRLRHCMYHSIRRQIRSGNVSRRARRNCCIANYMRVWPRLDRDRFPANCRQYATLLIAGQMSIRYLAKPLQRQKARSTNVGQLDLKKTSCRNYPVSVGSLR